MKKSLIIPLLFWSIALFSQKIGESGLLFSFINDSIKVDSIKLDSFNFKEFISIKTPKREISTNYHEVVIFYQKCSSCKLEMTKGFKEVIYYSNGDELISILDIKKKKFKYKIYKYL